ncbi:MAG: FG-GAP repeat protein [Pseudomarimonas sp.]
MITLLALVSPALHAAPNSQFPEKPAELDDAGWAALKQALGESIGQQAKLTSDGSLAGADGEANDQFGFSVALSGDTALVGARFDTVGANENQGSAYVFIRSGSTWTLQAKLTAGDGQTNDQFGWSVALAGGTALVGALFDDIGASADQGSAYVFARSGSTWTQQANI